YAVAHPDLAHPGPALWLAGFALFWVSGFDIIYATLDEQFDRAHRLHSMVERLGRDRALRVSAALHALAFACLLGAALAVAGGSIAHAIDGRRALGGPLGSRLSPVRILPGVLLAGAGALLFLEQRWAEDVNLAFFKVNVWVGLTVLAIVLATRLAAGAS